MRTLFLKNFSNKFIALMAAILFWFLLLSSENTFFVFPDQLKIEAFNVPEQLALVNELGTVRVTVRADQDKYKELRPQDFVAFVDLKNRGSGEQSVEVIVNVKTPGVSIVDISPLSVPLVLEELNERTFPLTLHLNGKPASNHTATLLPAAYGNITLRGAKSILEEVNEVSASLELKGNETTDITQTIELKALKENGIPLSNVKIEPSQMDLTAQIQLIQAQKTVGVKANVQAPNQLWIQAINVSPATVQILGLPGDLAGVSFIETELIHVPGARGFYEDEAVLILPHNIELGPNQPGKVNVSVSLTPVQESE